MKMTDKKRVGRRLYKRFDMARTPCQRVLDMPEATVDSKA